MTVDSENRRSPAKETYLDLIEFGLAELDDDENSQAPRPSAAVSVINRRKWANNRRVDYELLEKHKKNFLFYYSKFMESIVTLDIQQFNKYTSFIELNRVLDNCSEMTTTSSRSSYGNSSVQLNFSLLNQIKKCIIEVDTFKILNEQKELNWLKLANTLYPVKTIGDGNCLCHACLNYMVGMQDTNLNLRDMLKNYLSSDIGDKIKERWIAQRKTVDAANRILYDDELTNREWDEIKTMISNRKERKEDVKKLDDTEASAAVTSESTVSRTSITKLPTATITTEKTTKVISPTEKVLVTKTTTPTSTSIATSTIRTTPNEKLISTVTETQSLMYLEDVHIFALANMLARPIIVVSLQMVKDYQSNSLRGVYLPLLVDPEQCTRDPIVIAYHDFHFMPLLYSLDQEKSNPNGGPIKYNQKYFHFENIDQLDNLRLDEALYEKAIRMNTTSKSLSIRNKHAQLYNVLPLVYYYDLKTFMKLHFLSDQENDSHLALLKKYLTLVEIQINRDDLEFDDESVSPIPAGREVKIYCCVLDSYTNRVTKNGINLYLNYLNETIIKWNNPRETPRRETPKCKTSGCRGVPPPDDVNKFYGYCYDCFTRVIKYEPTINDEPEKLTQQMELITLPKSRPATASNHTDLQYKHIGSRICASYDCTNIIQESSISGPKGKYCDACSNKQSTSADTRRNYSNCKTAGCKGIALDDTDKYLGYCFGCIKQFRDKQSTSADTRRNYSKCKTSGCNGIAMDDTDKYLGYCYACFKLLSDKYISGYEYTKPSGITSTIRYCSCGRTLQSNNYVYCDFCLTKSPPRHTSSSMNNYFTNNNNIDKPGVIQLPIHFETSKTPLSSIDSSGGSKLYNLRNNLMFTSPTTTRDPSEIGYSSSRPRTSSFYDNYRH